MPPKGTSPRTPKPAEAGRLYEPVEGAVVHEAEIRVSGDGAVFKGIKLIKSSATS